MPRMSKVVRGAGADDLGEGRDADAHQLATGALLELLPAQILVADHVHRLAQGGRVVAGVVVPAGRRVIRELLGLDEVVHPEVGRILAQFVGRDVDHALDGVDGLGHAERAAIGDAAGRLVGVDAIDLDEGVLEVVRAGDDVEQAGRELRGVGGGVGVAVVGDGLDLEGRDLAFLGRAQLGVDAVVAGEGVGLQVLRAVLDPLDRLAGQERGRDGQHVARIDRHLAAEAAADVVGLDPDLVLHDGQPGAGRDEGDDGPDGVRRLARHVQREVPVDGVPVGDAAAGLDRGHVDARDVDVLADADLRGGQRGVGGRGVAGLPVPDVVVGLLRPAIGAEHEGVRLHAPPWGRRRPAAARSRPCTAATPSAAA